MRAGRKQGKRTNSRAIEKDRSKTLQRQPSCADDHVMNRIGKRQDNKAIKVTEQTEQRLRKCSVRKNVGVMSEALNLKQS